MNDLIRTRDERGFALLLALGVLFVLTLLGAVLMATVALERKTAGQDQRAMKAMDVAEAGVNEVTSRLLNGDIVLNPANPRATGQIFLTIAGSVPTLGVDSIAVETKQPSGRWLTYSTPDRGPNVLTVNWKTDAARTVVYKYNPTLNPAINTLSGNPIYTVHSTGMTGTATQAIVTDIVSKPYFANVNGAIAANQGIDFSGTSAICGENHSADTPIGTTIPACAAWELGFGNLPAGWSTGTITTQGATTTQGNPPLAPMQTGFYTGPWDAFGMGQAEFLSWIGAPVGGAPSPPKGIFYLDNNTTVQDQSGGWSFNGGDGEGLLYCDGDLHINGNFTYKGLIYCEGNLDINGTCWILGGIIVRGKSRVGLANGNFTCLYSADAISQEISKYGGQFTRLSWRQLP